jgi:hypothetical protein
MIMTVETPQQAAALMDAAEKAEAAQISAESRAQVAKLVLYIKRGLIPRDKAVDLILKWVDETAKLMAKA